MEQLLTSENAAIVVLVGVVVALWRQYRVLLGEFLKVLVAVTKVSDRLERIEDLLREQCGK